MSETDSNIDKQEKYHRLGLATSPWYNFKRTFKRIPKDTVIDGQIIPVCQYCGDILDEFKIEDGWGHSLTQLKQNEGCYFAEPAKKHFTTNQLMYHNEVMGMFLYWLVIILFLGLCIAVIVKG